MKSTMIIKDMKLSCREYQLVHEDNASLVCSPIDSLSVAFFHCSISCQSKQKVTEST